MRPSGGDDLQAALACVDALRESASSLRPQELLDAVCGIEVLTRKTHAAMLELLAGLDAAKVAGEQGFGSTWRLLSAMLDLSAGQARARMRDAEQLATRRSLTGEPLPAQLPATAAALASGAIGTGQLKVITQTMAALPSTVSQDDRDWAEATLAEHAQDFDPQRLRVIARRIIDQLDPDGPPHLPSRMSPVPRLVSCTSGIAVTAGSAWRAGLMPCTAPRFAGSSSNSPSPARWPRTSPTRAPQPSATPTRWSRSATWPAATTRCRPRAGNHHTSPSPWTTTP